MPTLIEKLKTVVNILLKLPGCRPVSVGGSVRDAIMLDGEERVLEGLESAGKDFDLEIFGAQPLQIKAALDAADIETELVGRAFPVYKVKGWAIDISFPRRETKTGDKHTDFMVEFDPNMTFKEASLRRDFTCNAIGYDWATDSVMDPYSGIAACRSKILHCVSDKFEEDALRSLRAFKFVARLGFYPSHGTLVRCAALFPKLKDYAKERLLPEWIDFILHADYEYIGKAFNYLSMMETGVYHSVAPQTEVFPELVQLINVPQSPVYHPEGSVWHHTIHCLEYFAGYIRPTLDNDEERLIVGLAVLTHDFGKATCTMLDASGAVLHSHGHEDSPLARVFLERLFDPADDRIKQVELLVKAHMRPAILAKDKSKASAVRRLNVAVEGRMDRLLSLVECDMGGRPPLKVDMAAITWVACEVAALGMDTSTAIKPFVQGRHLIEHLHLKPSKLFTPILKILFEEQLDGLFTNEEEGIKHLIACYRAEV